MNILLASTSVVFGSGYLEYIREEIAALFTGLDEIIFIPYARPGGITHDEYTAKVEQFFSPINIHVKGLHAFDDPRQALKAAQGFFTGGGNTFLLVKTLHELELMDALKSEITQGKPYLGASAGTNIAGINMQTTNDMPIVYPPSFRTMGLVPFNINPHYLDPVEGSMHMGETRETRLMEFLTQNSTPVVGLREGSWLRVAGADISLQGKLPARIFTNNKAPYELATGMLPAEL